MQRSARRAKYHLVRSTVRTGAIRIDAGPLQVGPCLVFRPCPDDVSAQSNDLPRLQLGRPGGYLLGMLAHELLHPGLKGFADGAQLRIQILVMLLRNLPVTPHPLPVILPEILRAKASAMVPSARR